MSIDINVRTLLLITLLSMFCYCYINCKKEFVEFFTS